MNAKQRYNARRAAKNREAKAVERKMITAVGAAMLDCSERVAKALTLIDYKASPRPKKEMYNGGSTCLPDVARFSAGHRKSKNVTAR
ncbi:TPA: transcriptional regulator [Serratia marcescens]